ncbi:hypothetical protein [Paenibacillus gansuensis]|uniref:Uncharacterized protein n=1 Tax=Paenibacillus gansuensis TaxID=306542 RepID=A0ABW5PH70_9BACL
MLKKLWKQIRAKNEVRKTRKARAARRRMWRESWTLLEGKQQEWN